MAAHWPTRRTRTRLTTTSRCPQSWPSTSRSERGVLFPGDSERDLERQPREISRTACGQRGGLMTRALADKTDPDAAHKPPPVAHSPGTRLPAPREDFYFPEIGARPRARTPGDLRGITDHLPIESMFPFRNPHEIQKIRERCIRAGVRRGQCCGRARNDRAMSVDARPSISSDGAVTRSPFARSAAIAIKLEPGGSAPARRGNTAKPTAKHPVSSHRGDVLKPPSSRHAPCSPLDGQSHHLPRSSRCSRSGILMKSKNQRTEHPRGRQARSVLWAGARRNRRVGRCAAVHQQ